MQEGELKSVPGLEGLQIYPENDPAAIVVTDTRSASHIAEADDMVRVQELLHRNEYRLLFGVRCQREEGEKIRVYFELLDND